MEQRTPVTIVFGPFGGREAQLICQERERITVRILQAGRPLLLNLDQAMVRLPNADPGHFAWAA